MATQKPEKYKNEIASLVQTFNLSLEEIKNVYPDYKLGTDTKSFLNDKKYLNSVKGNINKLQNDLLHDIETTREKIIALNDKLTILDDKNSSLTREYNSLNNQGLAAAGELKDQEIIARQIYIKNIILFLVIVINSWIYYKNSI